MESNHIDFPWYARQIFNFYNSEKWMKEFPSKDQFTMECAQLLAKVTKKSELDKNIKDWKERGYLK